MATSRITIRTIDYHKFRSLVIERDGVGEELRQRCDGDVTALCDAVRRLYDRRERFNDDDLCDDDDCRRPGRDLARFGEICGWYKLILENRRVRSVDVRLRSCWWEVIAEMLSRPCRPKPKQDQDYKFQDQDQDLQQVVLNSLQTKTTGFEDNISGLT